jgi:hypothetical protein
MRVEQIPQTPTAGLTFEILDDLRVMVGVTRLAHLGLINELGWINVSHHEVQQLCPITLGAL